MHTLQNDQHRFFTRAFASLSPTLFPRFRAYKRPCVYVSARAWVWGRRAAEKYYTHCHSPENLIKLVKHLFSKNDINIFLIYKITLVYNQWNGRRWKRMCASDLWNLQRSTEPCIASAWHFYSLPCRVHLPVAFISWAASFAAHDSSHSSRSPMEPLSPEHILPDVIGDRWVVQGEI